MGHSRWGIRTTLVLVVAAVLPACGGGGGGGGSAPPPATWSLDAAAIEIIAVPSYKDDDSLTFPTGDPTVDALTPGSIIYSTEGEGFLREVLAIDIQGGETLLSTKHAPLTALLTDLKATHAYAPGDILLQDPGPAAELPDSGVLSSKATVPGSGVHSKVHSAQTGFDIDVPLALGYAEGYGLFTLEAASQAGIEPDVEIIGSASVSITTEAAADITLGSVRMFRWQQTFTASIDATLSCSRQVFKKWEIPLDHFSSIPFAIGPVPCTLSVTPYFLVDASVQGEVGFSGTLTRTSGFEWTTSGGWRPINSGSESLSGISRVTGSVRGAFGVQVFLKVFGVAGPFIGVEVGADAVATVDVIASTLTLELWGFIAPQVGGKVELIIAGVTIYENEVHLPLPVYRRLIWSMTWSPPDAPTNLTASAQSSSILLAWQDQSSNEDGFRVRRRPMGGLTWTVIATLPPEREFYTDTTVLAGVAYVYTIEAYNALGDSHSNPASAAILAAQDDLSLGEDAADSIAGPSIIVPGVGTGSLEGNDIYDVYGVTLQAGSTLSVTVSPAGSLDVGLFLYDPDGESRVSSNDFGVVPESITNYVIDRTGLWRIVLRSFAGSGSYTLQVSTVAGPQAPQTPTLLAPADGLTGLTTVDLDWTDSTGTGPITYWLEIARDANFDDLNLSANTLTVSQYQISTLPPSTLFYWRVRALNSTQISDWSGVRTFQTAVTVPASHTVPTPSIPTGVTNTQVGVTESFSTTGALCSQGHSVSYRFSWGDGSSPFGAGVQTHSWPQSGSYSVQAQSQCTQGALSAWSASLLVFVTQTVVTLPDLQVESVSVSPTSGFPGSTITVDFTVRNVGGALATTGIADARIRLAQSPGQDPSDTWLLGTVGGVGPLAETAGAQQAYSEVVSIPSGIASGPYFVTITVNESGGLPETDVANNTQVFAYTVSSGTPPPSHLVATVMSSSSVFLSWRNYAFEPEGVTDVTVERSPNAPGSWTAIATLPPASNSYTDSTVTSGVAYYYRVGAVTGGGTAYSGTASATPTSSVQWTPVTTTGAPAARYDHTAVWTGSRVFLWGGLPGSVRYDGGLYDPATDTWSAPSVVNRPDSPDGHSMVWTGSEAIVWGGGFQNTGGRYDPGADMWTPTSTIGAPEVRSRHTAVWTTTHMIVWGGEGGSGLIATGGRYDPSGDSWQPVTNTGAPTSRWGHSAVWTGTRMIIWGGRTLSGTVADGGIYDPGADSWAPISTTNAPQGRQHHSAIWTGTHMIVWGGFNLSTGVLSTGAAYDPATDTWTALSDVNAPTPRSEHQAIWTGSRMILWGGDTGIGGGSYDPVANTWTGVPSAGAPTPENRTGHVMVWTGSLLFVWGGLAGSAQGTGGLYNPDLTLFLEPTAGPSGGDAYVIASAPDTVHNSTTTLVLNTTPASEARTFLYFDLGQIPAGASLKSASLELTAFSRGGTPTIQVYAVASGGSVFNEDTLTWNTQPGIGSLMNQGPAPVAQLGLNQILLDVAQVEAFTGAGLTNWRGLRVTLTGTNTDLAVRPSEYGVSSERPRLLVTYTP